MNNSIDVDKIMKKITGKPIMGVMSFIISIFFLIISLVGVVLMINKSDEAIIFVIVGLVLFVLFFLISYFKISSSKKRLKDVDFIELKKELMGEVLSYDSYKTYYTKNYLLSNYYYSFVIKYSDILWVYEQSNTDIHLTNYCANLAICLNNNKTVYLPYLKEFSDEIVKRNPKVLVGKNSENKKKYKELVMKFNK